VSLSEPPLQIKNLSPERLDHRSLLDAHHHLPT